MNKKEIQKLKDWIRKTLGFSNKIEIDYQNHPKVEVSKNE